MKAQHALIALLTLLAIPLALSLGAVLLIPVALVLVPVALIAAVAAVPALLVWLSRIEDTEAEAPASLAIPASAHTA